MNKMVQTECYKLVKSKKSLLVFSLFLLAIIGIVFYNSYLDINYKENTLKEMHEEKNYAANYIKSLNALLERSDKPTDTEDEKDFWEKESVVSLQLEYYFKEYNEDNWEKYLTLANKKYDNLLYGSNKGYINKALLKARQQTPEQLQEYLLLNRYCLEKNVQPLANPYRLTGINFLCILLEGYTPFILVALSVLFTVDIFQAEFDGGSYKLSFTQPYKRKTLFFSKIIAAMLLQLSIFMVSIVLLFILLGLHNGFGDVYAPKVLFSNDTMSSFFKLSGTGNIQIASSLEYILLGYVLLFAVMIMFDLLSILVAFTLNASSGSIGCVTGLIMLSIIVAEYFKNSSIIHCVNPLSYVSIVSVLKNRICSLYSYGVIINLALTFLFLWRSYKKFCNIDMQGGNCS